MIEALFIQIFSWTSSRIDPSLVTNHKKPIWRSPNNVSLGPLCESSFHISAHFWSWVNDWLRSTIYYFIGLYVHLENNRRSHPRLVFSCQGKFSAICSEILAFLFYSVFYTVSWHIVSALLIGFKCRSVESRHKVLLGGLVRSVCCDLSSVGIAISSQNRPFEDMIRYNVLFWA
jgi:hypothetical protein